MDRKELTEFVERIFELYGLNKRNYFYTEDFDGPVELCSPLPEEIPIENSLCRLSVYLGLSVEEIITMDKRAALKYWKKYPFFSLYNQFLDRWIWNAQFKSERPDAKTVFLSAIFNSNLGLEKRYNWPLVLKRLKEQLKELSAFDPAYYHEGRELEILNIETSEFFSFPECRKMIRDYIRMVKRLEELFFKAVEQDLSAEEINEYNFLVSYFDVSDVYRHSTRLYYHVVTQLRNTIKEEGHSEIWSYGKINCSLNIKQPWRCIEFFDDMTLIQEYVNLFPSAKKEIRNFGEVVRNFYFTVRWKLTEAEEEEEIIRAYLNDEEDDSEETYQPGVLHLYVSKTADEISAFEEPLLKLGKVIAPPSMGGIKLPVRETLPGPQERMKALLRRFNMG